MAERHNLGGGWVNYDFQQPLGAVATMTPLLAAFGFGTIQQPQAKSLEERLSRGGAERG